MDIIEIKKDSKKIEISKDTVIIVLSIGIIIVSGIAIFLSFRGGHSERKDFERGRIMQQYNESNRYIDDNNVNPNDIEIKDDQNSQATNVNASIKPVSTITPTSTATTNTPKK